MIRHITIASITCLLCTVGSSHGQAWQLVWEGEPNQVVTDVSFVSQSMGFSTVYGISKPSKILKTTDGGYTWVTIREGRFDGYGAIWTSGADTAWAVGDDKVHVTLDGWETKFTRFLPVQRVNLSFEGSDADGFSAIDCHDWEHCIAVGTAVFRTTFGLSGWEKVDPQPVEALPASFFSVSMIDRDRAWIAGGSARPDASDGYVFKTIDGGATWDPVSVSGFSWRKVHFFDDQKGYLLSWDGSFLTTDDGGNTWIERRGAQPGTGRFDAHFVDLDSGIVVGQNGLVEYTDDSWLTRFDDISADRIDPPFPIFRNPPYHETVFLHPSAQTIFVGGRMDGLAESNRSGVLKRIDCPPNLCVWTSVESASVPVPGRVRSNSIFPNPVVTVAKIDFVTERPEWIRLRIYDVVGRLVATPVDEWLPAGKHSEELRFGDLPSGFYYFAFGSGQDASHGSIVVAR